MHSIEIEIPHQALKPLIKAGTCTYRQLLDYWLKKDRISKLQLPKDYSQFTREHLRALSKYIGVSKTDDTWFYKLLRDLCGMKAADVNVLDGEHVLSIARLLDYLKEPYTNEKSLFQKIGIFRGPANSLKNYTIERLGYADSFAMAYHAEPKQEYLDNFFISAYRPFFLPWSKRLFAVKALYSLVSEETKQVALMNYYGLRANLVVNHPITFEGGDGNTGMEQFGWTGTILNLAGEKFGPYKQAKKVKVPDAFALFEMNGIQVKRSEEKLKSKK